MIPFPQKTLPYLPMRTHLSRSSKLLFPHSQRSTFHEDIQVFLHSCCCYLTRQAHTYDAAGISPFWMTFRRALMYGPFTPVMFAEYRHAMRNSLGRYSEWDDLAPHEKKKAQLMSCLCYGCYATQEARHVDEAMKLQVGGGDEGDHDDDAVAGIAGR